MPNVDAVISVFEKVDFSYTDQEQVLCDFDLHIKPGENIALVGHTGAGKSSIAKLVARFYEFQAGKITHRRAGYPQL